MAAARRVSLSDCLGYRTAAVEPHIHINLSV